VQEKWTDLSHADEPMRQVCLDRYNNYTEGTDLSHAPDVPCAAPEGARALNGRDRDITHAVAESKLSSAQRSAPSLVSDMLRDELLSELSRIDHAYMEAWEKGRDRPHGLRDRRQAIVDRLNAMPIPGEEKPAPKAASTYFASTVITVAASPTIH
jgi:hypothetical protein